MGPERRPEMGRHGVCVRRSPAITGRRRRPSLPKITTIKVMILIWRASGPSAPYPPIKALFAREKVCVERPVFIGSPAARDRSPPGQEPPKNDTLRFCGLVFAFEVIQSTTTLDKLVVLFPHLILFYRRKSSRSIGPYNPRLRCRRLSRSVRPLRRPNPRCRAKRIQHEIDPVWAPPH